MLDGPPEILYILEIPVNGGKTDIGHLIQGPQPIHQPLTDPPRRNLGIAQPPNPVQKLRHDGLERLGWNRSFLKRPEQPGTDLAFVKRFPSTISLDDSWISPLCRLKRGKPLTTARTLAPAPDALASGYQPGVDDPGILMPANRTVHERLPVDRKSPAQLDHGIA